MQKPGIETGFVHVFGGGSHAVVGAQRDEVIASADFLVETGEEIAKVFVQPDENVLDFAAARTESVADVVHGGIAHGKKVGSAGLAETQSVEGFLGEFSQSGVGIGAGRPLAVKRSVRFARARLSAQRMREREVPALGRNGAE